MMGKLRNRWQWVIFTVILGVFPSLSEAANPSAEQALRLSPIQDNVGHDVPSKTEAAQCRVDVQKQAGAVGWIVFDAGGRILRRFIDTNADNKVDQWCYFKDGLEIYRDIDANFNGKADQYRWLGTAGMRWGLDPNEDGRIDQWKMISPEEVTAEVVAALRESDAARFTRLLLSGDELNSLGLGAKQQADLKEKTAAASSGILRLMRTQKIVQKSSRWVHFGASQPGIVPSGSQGSSKDLIVYENVVAVVETAGKHGQIPIGTLVQVGKNWRIIDLPKTDGDGQVAVSSDGFFFQASISRRPEVETAPYPQGGLSKAVQNLIADYEATERAIAQATTDKQRNKLYQHRSDLYVKLETASTTAEDRANWIRQHADTLSAAAQSGSYKDALKQLGKLVDRLAKDSKTAKLAGYAKFRYLTSQYSHDLQKPKANYAKIQEQWLKNLSSFVKNYPNNNDTAEAMLQLALAEEFAGNESDAKIWYGRIVNDFPDISLAKKAAGARHRLESVGKSISLQGKTLAGKTVDLADYNGKVVLIHYWATWCDPCKQDLEVLKQAQAKYARKGFELIGISLDSDREKLTTYLNSNRIPWPQLYEEGGLDNRLATELGVLTLPLMILVDGQGRVIRRNIQAGELESELSKLLR